MSKPTFDQLPELFLELTNEVRELKNLLRSNSKNTVSNNKPFGIKEAADLVGLSMDTLYGKVHKKEIPHFKKNNRLYFFEEDLISWIKEGKKKTLTEMVNGARSYLKQKN